MIKKIIFIIVVLFCTSCSNSGENFVLNSSSNFDEALNLFENKKYLRAKSEFEFLIFNNPGSKSAILSQFYFSECLFHLNDYNEAIKQYEKFISISTDSKLITISKFLICKCYFNLSQEYYKDQTDTQIAINKCQFFIEEFSTLDNIEFEIHNLSVNLIFECENMIKKLRAKLSKKNLESGKLYLRIEEYDAALEYFNLILTEFYDSPYIDDALYHIVLINLLQNNKSTAERFLKLYEKDFIDLEKLKNTKKLFNNIKFNKNNYNYIIGILIGSYMLNLSL